MESSDIKSKTVLPAKISSKKQSTVTPGSLNLDSRVPCRMRGVQTENLPTKDIAIQCNDADDDDLDDWSEPEHSINYDEYNELGPELLSYMHQNTRIFHNGMLECLVCGEVSNNVTKHRPHMVIHYGPPVLCSECGELVSHRDLLRQHLYSCTARSNPQFRPSMHMQCPHLHCSHIIRSKQELRRHILKHLIIKDYYCHQCNHGFRSAVQFFLHRLQHASCSHVQLAYAFRKLKKMSNKTKINRCTVCYRCFVVAPRCALHKQRCILEHQKRVFNLLLPKS